MSDELQEYFLGGVLSVGEASQHPERQIEHQILYA